METRKPPEKEIGEFKNLAQLVEVIKSVWEGPEYCFIQRIAPDGVNFNMCSYGKFRNRQSIHPRSYQTITKFS